MARIHEANAAKPNLALASKMESVGKILNAFGIRDKLPPLVNRRIRPRGQLLASTRTPKTFPLFYLLFEGNIQRRSSMLYQ